MRNTIKYVVAALAAAAVLPMAAQNGVMFDMTSTDIMTVAHMADASRENSGYFSSRVAAMGGAYTSLGADLSSMTVNPAGLAMFRSSAFGFTASVTSNKLSNIYSPNPAASNRFAVNNIGMAFNIMTDDTSLRNATIGFAYNRLDDYNYSTRFGMGAQNTSILNVIANQMQGIPSEYLEMDRDHDPFNNTAIGLNQWGGILAHNTFLMDPVIGTDRYAACLEEGAVSHPYMDMINKGSRGEFDLSMAMNFEDVVYLGVTLGIQDIYHRRDYVLNESYTGQVGNPYVEYMGYNCYSVESGVGVNLKLGAVVNPFEGLRMGLTFHAPTYYTVDKSYVGSMWSKYSDETNEYYANTLAYDYTYEYNTANRLAFGVSYTMAPYAIFTMDYERAWYQSMRSSDFDHYYRAQIKQDVKENFTGADNVRLGVEVRPVPVLALRAGYSVYGSPYRQELYDQGYYFNSPLTTKISNVSMGLGFRVAAGVSIDLAAVFSTSSYTDFDIYHDSFNNLPMVSDNKLKRGIYSGSVTFSF